MTDDVSASELDYVQVDHALVERASEALDSAKRAGLKVVTAESCTGGLVAMVLSEAPGAAEFLEGGFVTYTPEQKCAALELDPLLIEKHGAVSAEVADAMARGALECSRADIAVSVTGVAGPEPDERGPCLFRLHAQRREMRGREAPNSATSAVPASAMPPLRKRSR